MFILAFLDLGLFWLCLGLFGFVFSQLTKCPFDHKPLFVLYLRSFDFFGIWLCFAYFCYNFVRNLSYFVFRIVYRVLREGKCKN